MSLEKATQSVQPVQPVQDIRQVQQTQQEQPMKQITGFTSFDIGFSDTALDGAAGRAGEIMAPLAAVTSVFKRIPKGLKNIGKKPASIIIPMIFSALWIILYKLRQEGHADNMIAGVLSWLSFGQNSAERSAIGVLGDILGKGVVVTGFTSLLTGGTALLKKGMSGILNRGTAAQGSMLKQNLPWFLCGVVGALAVSRFTAGAPSLSRSMVVIASAVMTIQAFVNSNSWLYGIAAAVTSKVDKNGKRTANVGAIRTIMTGMTAGFALMLLTDIVLTVVNRWR